MSEYILWTEKYKPTKLSEVIGNKTSIMNIKKWFKDFKNKKGPSSIKNALLLCSPPGTGKTMLAHLICKELNYEVIEINNSSVRNETTLNNLLGGICKQQNNILTMFKQNNGYCVIVDDIDIMNLQDKGGINTIISLLHPKKTIKSKRSIKSIPKIKIPFICCCTTITTKLKTLKKHCNIINMYPPPKKEIIKFIKKILKKENIKISQKVIDVLVEHSQYDMRRLVSLMRSLKRDFNSEKKLSDEEIIKKIYITDKKKKDVSFYKSIEKILYEKITPSKALEIYYDESSIISLLIHENIINSIENKKCNRIKKLDMMSQLLDNLSVSNLFESYSFKNQYWLLHNHTGILSCYKTNKILNSYPTKNKIIKPIKFPSLLSKRSIYAYNKNILNEICKKLNISESLFHPIISLLLKILCESSDKKEYDTVNMILTMLTQKQIDNCIKLSFNSEKIKKKWLLIKKKNSIEK